MIKQINIKLLLATPEDEIPKEFQEFLKANELNEFNYIQQMAMQEKYPNFFIDNQDLQDVIDMAIGIIAKEIARKVIKEMEVIDKRERPLVSNVKLTTMQPAPDFTGCNGEPVSSELLEIWMKKSIEKEDYERAAEIRDEISRRKNLKA